eukprot:TRINITY_DN12934_c0_g1_i1.p1 TRINITY_DN12934_c0_g1~~TRINITY_DN12934_c0_g1_i1.p1  ORF type:complete len:422 (-),score=91.63 TRINITY_DN12934_c0_g1_i1:78-1343(-)
MQLDQIISLLCIFSVVSAQDFSECGRTLDSHDITSKSELNAAEVGEFPHMCTLFSKVNGFNVFIGGASLVATNQLLTLATAVHKMRNFTLEEAREAEQANIEVCEESHDVMKEIFVSCGDAQLQSKSEEKQVSKISKILIHPDYNPRSLINDLAVLIVEEPFTLTASVGHVCLPSPQQEVKEGATCVATGHGREIYKFGSYSRDLRKVNLPIWSKVDCQDTLNDKFFTNKLPSNWEIHPSFICAGGKDQEDTCEGDGGGPLVCSSLHLETKGKEIDEDENVDPVEVNDDIFSEVDLRDANSESGNIVQVGVVAWGIKCGMEGMPSVYSSVVEGRCWLDQIMSCYSQEKSVDITAGNLDLRATDEAPDSFGKLTGQDCGAWLQTEGSNRAACGCKQVLGKGDPSDYDLRDAESDLDLRTIDV